MSVKEGTSGKLYLLELLLEDQDTPKKLAKSKDKNKKRRKVSKKGSCVFGEKKQIKKEGEFVNKKQKHIEQELKTKSYTHSKQYYSEFTDHLSCVNNLLDKKLEKELKYFRKEMLTNCRLINDKQRFVKNRYERFISEADARKLSTASTISSLSDRKSVTTDSIVHDFSISKEYKK